MLDGAKRQLTSQALMSAYNPSFGAPACLELGSSCQTDDDMIAGVASFEPNSPNTIDNCTDKSDAVYQLDEYVNRIIVRSKYGGTMTAGSWLEIHATVSKAVDVSSRSKPDAKETAHMYYASESLETNHPIGVDSTHHFGNAHWKWICSEMADPGGVDSIEVFSCDFQIPEGNFDTNGIQAVRINYGYGEYAIEACTKTPLWGEPYSDVDDLMFRIAPAPGSPSAMPSQNPSAPSPSPSLPPSQIEEANPTASPVASNFRFVCAASAKDARAQCLDNPPCPIGGTECENGSSCYPIHCSECPDIPCIDAPTSSPTEVEETGPPSLALTNIPTVMPTRAAEYYDELPPNSASGGWNYAWVVGVLLVLIDTLLSV
eukprot:CAMPEP_0201936138 /NCGR_PEP_ID=MMETSP0903-20130614/36898_1 /ASSEMBLY_ACC=CAM_ASM_000552 /TAXON_ID=420261 /ORGANISM="Thalassiosira antarctica, Strain CCMP982" /LENGTH=372 /DNA_ID=CAMNT_0048476753 /DNA_START=235 /DNA_END=1353 /DNA_ORIENTATION=-